MSSIQNPTPRGVHGYNPSPSDLSSQSKQTKKPLPPLPKPPTQEEKKETGTAKLKTVTITVVPGNAIEEEAKKLLKMRTIVVNDKNDLIKLETLALKFADVTNQLKEDVIAMQTNKVPNDKIKEFMAQKRKELEVLADEMRVIKKTINDRKNAFNQNR